MKAIQQKSQPEATGESLPRGFYRLIKTIKHFGRRSKTKPDLHHYQHWWVDLWWFREC